MQDDWEDKTVVAGDVPVAEAPDGKRAQLVVLAGPNVGEMYSLEGTHTMGRGRNADLRIRGDGVSRQHLRFVVNGEEVRLEDLGSTNGSFVNGERADTVTLRDGDKIQIGSATILKFTYQDKMEEDFQRQMYESASRDGLTGIYNKRFFQERLANEVAFAVRHQSSLSLLLFDIDHFKRINDCHGHPAGDYVLASLADIVVPVIRGEDLFARYGGEEFALLTRGIDAESAAALAERIRRAIEGFPFVHEGQELKVTTSVGVVTMPREDISGGDDLIAAADKALYEAKHSGRNRVVVASLAAAMSS
ncbi:MAG: GGDEF domain-containing protein [Myxococcales bacterium]|nr:GGDEF domain-containing protein [Myxococcales bacterium]MDD9970343.1 GGDEF domain-containing protein [Myxococcales bacterium]